MINLIKINSSEITITYTNYNNETITKSYSSQILLRGVSQDRQENRFALIKSIIHSRNAREIAASSKYAVNIDSHSRILRGIRITQLENFDGEVKEPLKKRNCFDTERIKRNEKNMIANAKACSKVGADSQNDILLKFKIQREKEKNIVHDRFHELFEIDEKGHLRFKSN